MHYQRYIPLDVVNGRGNRCTLFVSGCEHQCPNCYNPSTWSPHSGHLFTNELFEQILTDLADTRIPRHGLSLTGGDPLLPANCSEIERLARTVKKRLPEKNIWLWTGYTMERLSKAQRSVLQYVDVLIDGTFEQALADPGLPFRGSSNQRILEAPFSQDSPL